MGGIIEFIRGKVAGYLSRFCARDVSLMDRHSDALLRHRPWYDPLSYPLQDVD